LRFLYLELVIDIVFFFRAEVGSGNVLYQQLCLLHSRGEQGDQLIGPGGGEGFGRLGDGERELMQAGGEKRMLSRGQGGDAGERDVDAVVEGTFFLRGVYAGSVTVIGHIKFPGEGDAGAAVLGFLLAQAFAGELDVGAAQGGIVGSFRNGEGGGRDSVDGLAGDVVVETKRLPFSGGVVVHAFGADGEGRDAGVDLERG